MLYMCFLYLMFWTKFKFDSAQLMQQPAQLKASAMRRARSLLMHIESRSFPESASQLDGTHYSSGGVHDGIDVQHLMESKSSTGSPLPRNHSCRAFFCRSIRYGEGPSKYAAIDPEGHYLLKRNRPTLPPDEEWSGLRVHARAWQF